MKNFELDSMPLTKTEAETNMTKTTNSFEKENTDRKNSGFYEVFIRRTEAKINPDSLSLEWLKYLPIIETAKFYLMLVLITSFQFYPLAQILLILVLQLSYIVGLTWAQTSYRVMQGQFWLSTIALFQEFTLGSFILLYFLFYILKNTYLKEIIDIFMGIVFFGYMMLEFFSLIGQIVYFFGKKLMLKFGKKRVKPFIKK